MPRFRTGDVLFHKYRVERFISRGGFSEVYLVTHVHLHAPRALKILARSQHVTTGALAQAAQRFRLEARLGAQFAHVSSIVRVYDFEEDLQAGLLGLIMEYLPGGSLKDRIRQARKRNLPGLPVPFVVRTAYHAALGLAALHRANLVHRDIKPSNILFDAHDRAKIADLGVVQMENGLTQRDDTGKNAPRHPGTPEYMSPEQETQAAYLRPASDIYSLGVTLFEALTLQKVKFLPPGARASQFRSDVPPWLDDLLARMLEPDPRKRIWDGASLARHLQAHLAGEPETLDEALVTHDTLVTEDDYARTEQVTSQTGPPRVASPPPISPIAPTQVYTPTPPPPTGAYRRSSAFGPGLVAAVVLLLFLCGATAGVFAWKKGTASRAQAGATTAPPPPSPPSQSAFSPPTPETASQDAAAARSSTREPSPTARIVVVTVVPTDRPTATRAPTPTPKEQRYCYDAPRSPLRVGMRAYVCTRRDRVRLRYEPGSDSRTRAMIEPGTKLTILDGPECGDGWVWWEVRTEDGKIGWMAEGGDAVDPKFICPLETGG